MRLNLARLVLRLLGYRLVTMTRTLGTGLWHDQAPTVRWHWRF